MRHSNKKRDNVAKSRPGSNTVIIIMVTNHDCDVVGFLEYEFIKNKKFIIVPSKK